MDFAREAGAATACLSVVEANQPALSLYGKFGFQTAYGYSYRQGPYQGGRDATAGLVGQAADSRSKATEEEPIGCFRGDALRRV